VRNIAKITLSVFLVIFSFTSFVMAYETWHGVIDFRQTPLCLTKDRAILFKEPKVGSGRVVLLYNGEPVTVIDECGGFYLAYGNNLARKGWVGKELVKRTRFRKPEIPIADESLQKYFHFIILLLNRYLGFAFLVLLVLLVLSFQFLPRKAAGWATAVCLAFVIIGSGQGGRYQSGYLDYINHIADRKSLGFYNFCNIFFVPIFCIFHGGIIPYIIILYTSIKEHSVARRADQALANRRRGSKKEVEYHEDEHKLEGEDAMLPDIPDVRNKMKAIGEYFLDKSKDSTPAFDIKYLEDVKSRFLTQFKFISEGENKKLNLLIQHVNSLIEYERARNRLEHVEGEKRLDDARRYTEYKKLQAECMRHELEIVKLSQEMENIQGAKPLNPLKDLKERLRLENKKKEVYLDNKVKTLRRECANNIKLKRELRDLLAEETIKISGGKARNELSPEQLQELEDVEDYIKAEIDRL